MGQTASSTGLQGARPVTRVARLVAAAALAVAGLLAAAQLYLSVTTVKAHLRVVYAKLGVASRGQLTRRIGGGG